MTVYTVFELFATLYARCAYRKDGLSFSQALKNEEKLLSLVTGDGIVQAYVRKCIPVLCNSVERSHLLFFLEAECWIAAKKAQHDDDIRALVLAKKMLDGFDLQRNADTPIPQFITALAAFTVSKEEIKKILLLVAGSSPTTTSVFVEATLQK